MVRVRVRVSGTIATTDHNRTAPYIIKKSSYNELEGECRNKEWPVILLYAGNTALGYINTRWDMMCKATRMERVERKQSGCMNELCHIWSCGHVLYPYMVIWPHT